MTEQIILDNSKEFISPYTPSKSSKQVIFLDKIKVFILFFLGIFAWAEANSTDDRLDPGQVFSDCNECPSMVVISGGVFKMGAPPSELGRPTQEGSVRKVTIDAAFAIGVFEITRSDWKKCADEKKCEADSNPLGVGYDHPVVKVSWNQAEKYVKWLSKKTGHTYRLPTEAEWEYSARAGADRSRFFGIADKEVCFFGNLYDLSAEKELGYDWEHIPCFDQFVETAPVGMFRPNAFGVYDMLGNVWEWTEDCASASARGIRTDSEAVTSGDCSQRSFRGGSWLSHPPKYLRFADRYKFRRAKQGDLGFRVARDIKGK